LSPCHNFRHSFDTCVATAFARNASLPFRCHVCCQGLVLAIQVFAIEFAACAFAPAAYLPVFFATDVAINLCPPSVCSIHVALQIATAIAIAIDFALKVAMLVAIKFGRLMEHFLNFTLIIIIINRHGHVGLSPLDKKRTG